MADNETSEVPGTKKIKQSISVPFLWEEKPGIPKKDWQPRPPPKTPPQIAPPLKFVASVPFQWEEKPGKPLSCFSQPAIMPPQADIISPLSPPRNSEDDDDDSISQDGGIPDNEMTESEPERDDFESDYSFSSAKSLLANGLMPTFAISNALPFEQTFLNDTNSGQLQCLSPPASETGSTTSSYATGTTSVAGASFLQWLFPLLTPGEGTLDKVGCQEKAETHTPPKESHPDDET